ncbi:hypothetical protein [Oceanibaculum sp.]|uniref:hypothetical protein n=1 Tax=Oceanibaculum sp. TaxID=1903597 RepID=UPI002590FE1B|nr:hypothetical protein [Oceanibaculum sp.]MCH2394504.1 hypothetical protein [Oceanibaculum sp.]
MSGLSMGNIYFTALEFLGLWFFALLALAAIWAVLAVLALRTAPPPDRARPRFLALLAGIVAAILTALLLPAWTDAGFHHVAVLADYVLLIGGAAGIGAAVGIALLPVLWLAARPRS